jgi:hypothetical protein
VNVCIWTFLRENEISFFQIESLTATPLP